MTEIPRYRSAAAALVRLVASLGLLGVLAHCRPTAPEPVDDTAPAADVHAEPTPPIAPRDPTRASIHGQVVEDAYAWLRDRDDPRTRAYLDAENAYAQTVLAPTSALQERIYAETLAHIVEDRASPPAADGPFAYYTRTETGRPYAIHCRRPRDRMHDASAEQIVLDENTLAEDQPFFSLGSAAASPDHRTFAVTTDVVGNERYTVRVLDHATGTWGPEAIENAAPSVVWAQDGRTILYVLLDDTNRPYRVMRHVVGTPVERDALVYEEPDASYYVAIGITSSRRLLIIQSGSQVTTEVRILDAEHPEAPPRVVAARRTGVEYTVEHHGDALLVTTNEDALDFRVMRAPLSDLRRQAWTQWRAHEPGVPIASLTAFAGHVAITKRRRGVSVLEVVAMTDGSAHEIEIPGGAGLAWLDANAEFETTTLRYGHTSMVTPTTIVDYDMNARTGRVVDVQPVRDYDATRYATERIEATAPDGTRVPISLVYRAPLVKDGERPVLLEGYGAYGSSYDPSFSIGRLALLERGVVVGIAHVRGGGDLGRGWYEAGKLERKRNTFSDFVACAEHLVTQGYTSPSRLAIRGGSAGGLLMGAVVNQRPDLFAAVVADVPFVDVVNTMLDETLPLTAMEWEEWGDPRDPAGYALLRSYSPYDNVVAQGYPAMLVLAGWNDTRVGYWEPAKWVARLRATKTDDNPLLLVTEMHGGHGGASGLHTSLRATARWSAFVAWRLGATEPWP